MSDNNYFRDDRSSESEYSNYDTKAKPDLYVRRCKHCNSEMSSRINVCPVCHKVQQEVKTSNQNVVVFLLVISVFAGVWGVDILLGSFFDNSSVGYAGIPYPMIILLEMKYVLLLHLSPELPSIV